MSTATSHDFATLSGENFIVLTTYRRSGEAVPTTVWFAEENGKLYITTGKKVGKVKRIRNNSHVSVAPSDRIGNVSGPTISGIAKLLSQDEAPVADAALNRKYGEERQRVLAAMGGRNPAETAYIEISPAQDAN